MKIAIITATYPPYAGGTGNVCAAHANGLRELGHEVHIFTAGQPQDGDSAENIHRLPPLLRVGNGVFLPQLLWKLRGFDIIHWHYPFFGGEIVALAAWLTRTPLIVTYHQDVILDGWLGHIAALLENTIGRWALRAAATVLFTSADYAQHSKMRRHLRPAKIGVLSNGVDVGRFSVELPTKPHPHFLPSTFTVLLVAGLDAAHYFKGVSILLQATAKLDGVRAVIVGDGALREDYVQKAHALGIAERIIFAGRISNELLPHYYQLADVTVLPSTTMGEAFGLVLVESFAAGTPVIASDLPGVRTVVSPNVDGYLVTPCSSDALAAAIQTMQVATPERRAQMGKMGQAKVRKQFTWGHICSQLDALYQHHRSTTHPIK